MIALEHWSLPPFAVALLVVLALHERGLRRVRNAGGDGRSPLDAGRQAWLGRAGLAWATLLWASPLGYWAHDLLFARVGLELGLAFFAAPLIVLGAPWLPLAAAVGRARPTPSPGGSRATPLRPVTATALWLASFFAWNVPAVLDPTVTSAALRDLEAACFLGAGVLLWMQIVGSHPFSNRGSLFSQVGLICGVLGVCWADGAAMVFARNVWYRSFAGGPGTVSRVGEQGIAGALTWVAPLLPFAVAAMWLFATWIDRDESDWELHWEAGGHRRPGTAEDMRVGGPETSR